MLSRRIPLVQAPQPQPSSQGPPVPPKQPMSAVPLHLQRSGTVTGAPQRVTSPQLAQTPMSPPVTATPLPYRPASPFRNRTATSIPPPARVQSPAPSPSTFALRRPIEDVEVDVVVKHISRESLAAENPFRVKLGLTVSAPVLSLPAGQPKRTRILFFVIQHIQPPRNMPSNVNVPPVVPQSNPEPWSPRLPSSGFSTPSPYASPYKGDFHDALAQKLLVASPREAPGDMGSDAGTDADGRETAQETPAPPPRKSVPAIPPLPAPFATTDPSSEKPKEVVFLGPSTYFLDPMKLTAVANETPGLSLEKEYGHERTSSESTITSESEADSELEVLVGGGRLVKVIESQDFELEYLPLRSGFLTIGGLRVLLVEDKVVDESEDDDASRTRREVRVLKELDVIGEVWVKSSS